MRQRFLPSMAILHGLRFGAAARVQKHRPGVARMIAPH
jgi:hypothetical protein